MAMLLNILERKDQWTVRVKPYRNEDMSAYVKKIQFKLHESYGSPVRVAAEPPYETGWSEFEIIIKILFTVLNERPVIKAVSVRQQCNAQKKDSGFRVL